MKRLIARRLLQLPLILLVNYTLTLTLAWMNPDNPLENPRDAGRRPRSPSRCSASTTSTRSPASTSATSTASPGSAGSATLYRAGRRGRPRSPGVWASPPPDRPVFDFGPSLQYDDWTVNEIIRGALPVSVTLGAAAIAVALVVGLTAGVIGAIKPNSPADLATLAVALVGISLPSFVVGSLALLLFAVLIPVFPVARWGTLSALVLPACTLSLPFAAYIARLPASA